MHAALPVVPRPQGGFAQADAGGRAHRHRVCGCREQSGILCHWRLDRDGERGGKHPRRLQPGAVYGPQHTAHHHLDEQKGRSEAVAQIPQRPGQRRLAGHAAHAEQDSQGISRQALRTGAGVACQRLDSAPQDLWDRQQQQQPILQPRQRDGDLHPAQRAGATAPHGLHPLRCLHDAKRRSGTRTEACDRLHNRFALRDSRQRSALRPHHACHDERRCHRHRQQVFRTL